MPFAILSCVVLVWGLPKVKLAMNRATTPAFKVMLADGKVRPGPPGWDVPYLHNAVYSRRPSADYAGSRACPLRFQLAVGDWHGLLPRRPGFWTAARFVASAAHEDILANLSAHAVGHGCHLVHARLGYVTRYSGLDAVLGIAFTRTGWAYPFFWHLPRLAGRCADRERYFIKCSFRKPAANHLTTTWH